MRSFYRPTKISYLGALGTNYAPFYEGQPTNVYLLEIFKRADPNNTDVYNFIIEKLMAGANVDLLNIAVVEKNEGENNVTLSDVWSNIIGGKEESVGNQFTQTPTYRWFSESVVMYPSPMHGDMGTINEFLQFIYECGGLFFYICFSDEELGSEKAIKKKDAQLDLLLTIKPSFIPLDVVKAVIYLSAFDNFGIDVDSILLSLKNSDISKDSGVYGDELEPESPLKEPTSSSNSKWWDNIGDWLNGGLKISEEMRKWFPQDSSTTNNYYGNLGGSSSDFSSTMPYILVGGAFLLGVVLLLGKSKKGKDKK